jgi:Neuraminidase (sialidase)
MIGQTIGAFAVEDQDPDDGDLWGVDGNAGYLDNLNVADTYDDYGTDYTAILSTKSLDGGDPLHVKVIDGFIIGAKATSTENVSVKVDVDEGATVEYETVTMTVSAPVVADTTLVADTTIVGGVRFKEYPQYLASPLIGQRVGFDVTYTGGRQFSIKRLAPIAERTSRFEP